MQAHNIHPRPPYRLAVQVAAAFSTRFEPRNGRAVLVSFLPKRFGNILAHSSMHDGCVDAQPQTEVTHAMR